MSRNGKIFILIGGRGSGKTTYLERVYSKCTVNTVVYQLFNDDRYKGFEKKLYSDLKIGPDIVNKKLIIEDATQLIAANLTNDFKKLLVSCKQFGSDITLVFHNFNAVPPFLWALFDYCIVMECKKAVITPTLKQYESDIYEIQNKKTKKYAVKGVLYGNT